MKLVHQDWEKAVILNDEKVPLISIENPQCLYHTLKELEEENARLKRMYANLAMELDVAKYIIEKKL